MFLLCFRTLLGVFFFVRGLSAVMLGAGAETFGIKIGHSQGISKVETRLWAGFPRVLQTALHSVGAGRRVRRTAVCKNGRGGLLGHEAL